MMIYAFKLSGQGPEKLFGRRERPLMRLGNSSSNLLEKERAYTGKLASEASGLLDEGRDQNPVTLRPHTACKIIHSHQKI